MTVPVIETTSLKNQTSNVETTVITAPSGIQTGDLLFIIIALDGDAANPSASGFVQMPATSEGTVELYFLRKTAELADESKADYTVNWTGSQQGRFIMCRISGKIGTGIHIVGTGNTGNATTAAVNAITTTVVNTLAIACCAVDRDRVDDADDLTIPNGFTEFQTSGSSGGANGVGLIVAQKDMPVAADTLQPTFGTWVSDGFASRMVTILGDPTPPILVAKFINQDGADLE